MRSYFLPAKISITVFPLLVFLLVLPLFIYQYRKYGAVTFSRSIILYAFFFYLLSAYFFVILPLPDKASVANATGATVQLRPFAFVDDFIQHTFRDGHTPTGIVGFLTQNVVLQPLFNVLMLLPFGVFLRYYFNVSLGKTVLFSFLLSLFFELTQLSGLYGIYPRPYRIFDVDDLLCNTLGGYLGYLIAPKLTFFLPSREQLDQRSYRLGERVGYLRRGIAMLLDIVFASLFQILLTAAFFYFNKNATSSTSLDSILHIVSIVLYFMVLPALWGGKTFGKALVKIKLVRQKEKGIETKAPFLLLAARYTLFYILYPKAYQLFSDAWTKIFDLLPAYSRVLQLLGILIYALLHLALLLYFAYCAVKNKPMLYERISQTHNINTTNRRDLK